MEQQNSLIAIDWGQRDRQLGGVVASNIKHTMSRRERVGTPESGYIETIEPWWPVRPARLGFIDRAMSFAGWAAAIAALGAALTAFSR